MNKVKSCDGWLLRFQEEEEEEEEEDDEEEEEVVSGALISHAKDLDTHSI